MARIIDFVLHAAKVRDIGRDNHLWLYRLYRLRMIMKTLFADDNLMGHGELVIDFPKKIMQANRLMITSVQYWKQKMRGGFLIPSSVEQRLEYLKAV